MGTPRRNEPLAVTEESSAPRLLLRHEFNHEPDGQWLPIEVPA